MARIAYDDTDADAFARSRHLTADGTAAWLTAVGRFVRPGSTLLDLGSGTGHWARTFTDYDVVAVEPSAAMRARSVFPGVRPGDAAAIPMADDSVDAVWLSTVVHHIGDLAAAAREIRRVLRPGGVVLIRSAFEGRTDGITLFRYFPLLPGLFPTVGRVERAFGLRRLALEPIPQLSSPTLAEAAASLRREAHTPLQLLPDTEFAAGMARLRAAAAADPDRPVVDTLDLLVLG